MSGKRLFNRNFVLLFFSVLALSLCHGMFCNAIPLYLTERGYGTSVAGYLTAAFAVVAMLSRIFGGRLTDKFRKNMVVAVGCAMYAVGCIFFTAFSAVFLLLLFRMLHGMGFSAATTAAYAACADVSPEDRVSEGIAYFGISQNISSAFSAMIVLAVIGIWGHKGSFWVSAAIAVIGCVCALLVVTGGSQEAPAEPRKEKFNIRNYCEKTAIPIGMIGFLVNFGYNILGMYLTLYAVNRGYSNPGLFFTISTIVMMLTKALAGKAGNRIPTLAIIVGCSVFGAASLFMIALINNELVLYLAGVFYGIGCGANIARLDGEVYLRAPVERRGAATATYMFFSDVAFGLGGLVWGVLMDLMPHNIVFLICGFVLAGSAVAAPFLFRIGRPKKQTV